MARCSDGAAKGSHQTTRRVVRLVRIASGELASVGEEG